MLDFLLLFIIIIKKELIMWRLTSKIPNKVAVAVSGGPDSMALLHFVSQSREREVFAATFDHNTGMACRSLPVIKELCKALDVTLLSGKIKNEKPKDQSPEEFWRNERYAWLDSLDMPVITGHNLDDVVETYLWSALNGTPKLIPVKRNNVIRPLLAVTKKEILEYCEKHSINYVIDPSNTDRNYTRAKVRNDLIPVALTINPGLFNMIKRKVLNDKYQK